MVKTRDKSVGYAGIGTGAGSSDSASDSAFAVAPGIGTRISAAAEAAGSRKSAASIMGVSSDALQRYIRESNQPTFEAVARLCLATGYRIQWLATGIGPEQLVGDDVDGDPGPASHDLSEEHLTIALELADGALGRDRWLPRPRYALLVRLLYQGVAEGLPKAQIQQLATALAGSMATGGSGNGGKQGVGQGSAGGAGRSDPKATGQGDW